MSECGVCVCVCVSLQCMNETVTLHNLTLFIYNLYTWLIVIFCIFVNALYAWTVAKQITVCIQMSLANKYPCIFVCAQKFVLTVLWVFYFVMGYVLQSGEIAPKRVQYYYYCYRMTSSRKENCDTSYIYNISHTHTMTAT